MRSQGLSVCLVFHCGTETDEFLADAVLDDVFQPGEGTAANEQDVRSIDLQELLLRVLAAPFGGNGRQGALDDLEQGLLDAFAADIAGDGRVVALARDLVDLVDVDNAALSSLYVVIGVLQQADDDVLDVFADVAGLGQVGGIRDGERHVEDTRQGLCQQRLARARWGQGARYWTSAARHRRRRCDGRVVDALVVVVHGHRQDLLGALLADDVLVEDFLDLLRLGDGGHPVLLLFLFDFLGDDVVAEADALVADVEPWVRR